MKKKKDICGIVLFSFNKYVMSAFLVPGTVLEPGVEE